MTVQPTPGTGDPGPDLEYDLAHEAAQTASPAAGERPPNDPVRVVTRSADDDGGDYGYDLAHDVPGR